MTYHSVESIKSSSQCKSNKKAAVENLPAMCGLAGLILVAFYLDTLLNEMGTQQSSSVSDAKAHTAISMNSGMWFEFTIIMFVLIIPSLYMKLGKKSSRASKMLSQKQDPTFVRLPPRTCHAADNKSKAKIQNRDSGSNSFVRKEAADNAQDRSSCESSPIPAAVRLSKMNQAINAAAKTGDFAKAEALLGEIQTSGLTPDAISYNSVIHACTRRGALTRAEAWVEKMRGNGVSPNVISYNILMDAYVKADIAEGAEDWLRRMIDAGVQPNEISYATVIHARAKQGDIELASSWLRKMLDAGVGPNVVSYNSLIYACSRRGDVERAEQWLQEMEEKELQPRVTTYTAVIDACAKCGDIARAEKWMEKMISVGIEPNVVTYSTMIDTSAKAESLSKAEFWYTKMVEAGVQPNAHSFSAVISACAKAGNITSARQWLKRMGEAGVPSDVVVYSGVLDACAKANDPEQATQVFEQMLAADIKPNVIAYSSLARSFAQGGNWQAVEELSHAMKKRGMAMNEYFLYALLVAYTNAQPRQSERAEAAFKEASAEGVACNKHIQAALGRCLGRQRTTDLVSECANSSQNAGKPRNDARCRRNA